MGGGCGVVVEGGSIVGMACWATRDGRESL